MKSALQFLERVYLPGYMTVISVDYSRDKAWFDFNPKEPPVTVLSDRYLTPRGTHICLSQAAYCFFERLMADAELLDPEEVQERGFEGRLKLVEFNQKFRREVGLSQPLQGRLTLVRLRPGRMPIVKFDFDLGSRAITGNMTGLIAPRPMPQANADILRI